MKRRRWRKRRQARREAKLLREIARTDERHAPLVDSLAHAVMGTPRNVARLARPRPMPSPPTLCVHCGLTDGDHLFGCRCDPHVADLEVPVERATMATVVDVAETDERWGGKRTIRYECSDGAWAWVPNPTAKIGDHVVVDPEQELADALELLRDPPADVDIDPPAGWEERLHERWLRERKR